MWRVWLHGLKGPSMRLDGVALLAAPTTRSQAYLQALVANELYPDHVIGMGEPATESIDAATDRMWQGVALPNLGESLSITCGRAGIPLVVCNVKDVNTAEAVHAVREIGPRIVIYSGYGGQIIADEMLDCGPQFLHVHSGWLPEYRGSTTIYYALLNGEDPGVTALILDRNIDTGPIVARRRYPKPYRGLDIDRVYDPAIRADLLVQVMAGYARSGLLPSLESQTWEEGINYYVIHPVLKHLAVLTLDGRAAR